MNFKALVSFNPALASLSVSESAIKKYERPPQCVSYAKDVEQYTSTWQQQTLRAMFADANHDNVFTQDEFSQYAAERSRNIDTIDSDNDGRVSFAEELQYALDTGKIDQNTVDTFIRTDSNGDGDISAKEQQKEAWRWRIREIG